MENRSAPTLGGERLSERPIPLGPVARRKKRVPSARPDQFSEGHPEELSPPGGTREHFKISGGRVEGRSPSDPRARASGDAAVAAPGASPCRSAYGCAHARPFHALRTPDHGAREKEQGPASR